MPHFCASSSCQASKAPKKGSGADASAQETVGIARLPFLTLITLPRVRLEKRQEGIRRRRVMFGSQTERLRDTPSTDGKASGHPIHRRSGFGAPHSQTEELRRWRANGRPTDGRPVSRRKAWSRKNVGFPSVSRSRGGRSSGPFRLWIQRRTASVCDWPPDRFIATWLPSVDPASRGFRL